MRNLEIKIRLMPQRLDQLAAAIAANGATITVLTQVDTYFAVARGRLKLREITPEAGQPTAELIAYRRPDQAGPRWSTYQRLTLPLDAVADLKQMLAGTVGQSVVVTKRRTVAIRGRSRIHLDQVEGLGAFLEIETVAGEGDDADGIDQELRATLEWLGVDPRLEVSSEGSYADLMQQPHNDERGRRR
jgi:predicted adenylyl cyclase CyaB